jgi:hypothetical protein
LRRTAVRALLLLAGACAALAVINAFDEDLSPEAASYLAPEKAAVPDARNAYLAMLGLDVPAGALPHEAGRKRLDLLVAAIQANPLLVDAIPPFNVERPLTAAGKFEGCRGVSSCLYEVASNEGVPGFIEANGPLLKRYRELMAYPAFSDAVPLSAFGTVPTFLPLLAQARQLFHADIARRVLQSPESGGQALADLARQIEFDRRNLAAAGLSLSKLVFAAYLRDDYLLLSDVLQHVRSQSPSRKPDSANPVLVPLTAAEKSLAGVLKAEARQTAETLRQLRQAMLRLKNPHADIQAANPQLEVRSPFLARSTAVNFLLAWFYQPNAAINEWFRIHRAIAALASAPAAARIEAARGGDQWIRDVEPSTFNVFNFAGQSAARTMALPGHALSYSFFLDDLDGLMRLVLLKAEILAGNVPPSGVAAHIESREALRNVYTGAAMQHRVRQHESGTVLVDLWFEPMNASWKQRDFGLGAGKVAVTVALQSSKSK